MAGIVARYMSAGQTLGCAALSVAAYWTAFEPLNLALAAWLVPAFWACLICQPGSGLSRGDDAPQLSDASDAMSIRDRGCGPGGSWRLYATVWIAGTCFWLLVLSRLSVFNLSRFAESVWIALSVALGLFWVAFIGLSRIAVWHLGTPMIVAAPLVWTGVEWVRKNWFFGGFSCASLEHSQYRNLPLIQIADIGGEYAVGILIVLVGTCIGRAFAVCDPVRPSSCAIVRLVGSKRCAGTCGLLALIVAGLYGQMRLSSFSSRTHQTSGGRKATIALLQGNIEPLPGLSTAAWQGAFEQYSELSRNVPANVDLVVWPEDTCDVPLYDIPATFVPANWVGQPQEKIDEMLIHTRQRNQTALLAFAEAARADVLLGARTLTFAHGLPSGLRNSAILVSRTRGVGPQYDKVNLVPFFEYNPLPRLIPAHYLPQSNFTAGEAAPPFLLRSDESILGEAATGTVPDDSALLRAVVFICYDSFFPAFIRNQVSELTDAGHEPDIIITLSNHGLCSFNAMSAMHLATHVFRAVENRKQCLTATNCGRSAWIDATGNILKEGQARQAGSIIATVIGDSTSSPYRYWGDWMAQSCLVYNALLIGYWGVSVLGRWKPKTR